MKWIDSFLVFSHWAVNLPMCCVAKEERSGQTSAEGGILSCLHNDLSFLLVRYVNTFFRDYIVKTECYHFHWELHWNTCKGPSSPRVIPRCKSPHLNKLCPVPIKVPKWQSALPGLTHFSLIASIMDRFTSRHNTSQSTLPNFSLNQDQHWFLSQLNAFLFRLPTVDLSSVSVLISYHWTAPQLILSDALGNISNSEG